MGWAPGWPTDMSLLQAALLTAAVALSMELLCEVLDRWSKRRALARIPSPPAPS